MANNKKLESKRQQLYSLCSVLSLRSIMHDALLIAGVIKFSLSSASFLRYCHWFWCCMQLHHFSNIQFLWGLGVMVYGLYSLFLIPNSCLFLVGFMVECYQSTATAHAAAGANEFLNFSCSLDFCLLWCYCRKANVGRERERDRWWPGKLDQGKKMERTDQSMVSQQSPDQTFHLLLSQK